MVMMVAAFPPGLRPSPLHKQSHCIHPRTLGPGGSLPRSADEEDTASERWIHCLRPRSSKAREVGFSPASVWPGRSPFHLHGPCGHRKYPRWTPQAWGLPGVGKPRGLEIGVQAEPGASRPAAGRGSLKEAERDKSGAQGLCPPWSFPPRPALAPLTACPAHGPPRFSERGRHPREVGPAAWVVWSPLQRVPDGAWQAGRCPSPRAGPETRLPGSSGQVHSSSKY